MARLNSRFISAHLSSFGGTSTHSSNAICYLSHLPLSYQPKALHPEYVCFLYGSGQKKYARVSLNWRHTKQKKENLPTQTEPEYTLEPHVCFSLRRYAVNGKSKALHSAALYDPLPRRMAFFFCSVSFVVSAFACVSSLFWLPGLEYIRVFRGWCSLCPQLLWGTRFDSKWVPSTGSIRSISCQAGRMARLFFSRLLRFNLCFYGWDMTVVQELVTWAFQSPSFLLLVFFSLFHVTLLL